MRFLPEIASCAFLLALIFGAMAWVQRKEIAAFVRDVMVGAEVGHES